MRTFQWESSIDTIYDEIRIHYTLIDFFFFWSVKYLLTRVYIIIMYDW